MGADGNILIYDAARIDAADLKDLLFTKGNYVGEQRIFGHRIYHVYYGNGERAFDAETYEEYRQLKEDFEPYLIGDWTVWT